MGSIDIIKCLSTVLSTAINKSQQHWKKNYWERGDSNPRLLGEKIERHLCAMHPPRLPIFHGQKENKGWV